MARNITRAYYVVMDIDGYLFPHHRNSPYLFNNKTEAEKALREEKEFAERHQRMYGENSCAMSDFNKAAWSIKQIKFEVVDA